MNLKYRNTPRLIGQFNGNPTVKASGSEQGRVKGFGAVCSRQNNNPFAAVKAVHLGKKLVKSLLTLIVAGKTDTVTLLAYRIDFIDKNDAGSFLFRLLKQITHFGGAHSYEHFDEFRTGNRKEGNSGFSGDGSGYQSFTGSGRTDKKHSLRQSSAYIGVFFRIMQKINYFPKRSFCFVRTGYIAEFDTGFRFDIDFCVAFAERHSPHSADLINHLLRNKTSDQYENRNR